MKIQELSISDLFLIRSHIKENQSSLYYMAEMEGKRLEENEDYQENFLLIEKIECEIERRIKLLK
jgi:hypothetical protein